MVHVQLGLLTNCSRIPVITERVQRDSEMMHVIMMMQSNVTDRYMFFAAEREEEFKSFPQPADSTSGFVAAQLRGLTCTRYFPVFALVDVDVIVQVNLYPAAVGMVAEGDL